jgi:hypothetical protein
MVAIDQFLEEFCSLNELSVSRTSFFLFADIHLIFGTLLCHTNLHIKFEFDFDPLIFPNAMTEKYHESPVFRVFFLCLQIIHLIFGTLLCHNKIQIKFEFGFDPFKFQEVMSHGLRKILPIVTIAKVKARNHLS